MNKISCFHFLFTLDWSPAYPKFSDTGRGVSRRRPRRRLTPLDPSVLDEVMFILSFLLNSNQFLYLDISNHSIFHNDQNLKRAKQTDHFATILIQIVSLFITVLVILLFKQ
jgi:hypothetical protein